MHAFSVIWSARHWHARVLYYNAHPDESIHMYLMLFGDTTTNFRRWNYCFAGMMLLLLGVWFVLNHSDSPASGSRGWGPALGYALLAVMGLLIYWCLLLYKLTSALKLNFALWLLGSIVAAPLSVAVVHFLLFFKVRLYLESGGD